MYSIFELKKLVKAKNIFKPIRVKKFIDENFPTSSPSSLYGFTKLASEKLIHNVLNNSLKFLIIDLV